MIKFEELLKNIQGLENIQKELDWHSCIPWEIWVDCFAKNEFKVL
jgi:hypothetical protein